MGLSAVALLLLLALQQAPYEQSPIEYSRRTPRDPIAALRERLEKGDAPLRHDDAHGYLASLLSTLSIPVASQGLVFSKTSFQRQRIDPRHPRALYFNDDVYVGWVEGGEVIEIASMDPQLGAVFYTLDQEPARIRLLRQTDACLQCHDSSGLTLGVPGLTVRSVYPSGDGTPHYNRGTFKTTYRSPLSERWGGWYVTGTHGTARHLGNVQFPDDPAADATRLQDRWANLTDLSKRMDPASYLSSSSDIVALMVLETQTHLHNLITRANHETRIAIVQSDELNALTGDPKRPLTPGAQTRIRASVEPLVEGLFYSGEAPFEAPVKGDTSFASDFEKRGPSDRKGRSLRQFDLERRLFRYPLSYLVYSASFAGLPPEARELLAVRIGDILRGRDRSKAFAHLSDADRAAILEILRETLPESVGLRLPAEEAEEEDRVRSRK